ncbi:hypothetical protein QBC41DRAFT_228818, partial [Cercophora samala]
MLPVFKLTTATTLLALTVPAFQQEVKGVLEVDAATGIAFLHVHPSSSAGFRIGFALPVGSAGDVILQITTPLNGDGSGWGGVALTSGGMRGGLLVASWPDAAGNVTTLPLLTDRYASPIPVHPDVSVAQIQTGTYTNATHLTSTFFCPSCLH